VRRNSAKFLLSRELLKEKFSVADLEGGTKGSSPGLGRG
jgi:hypothetical protein